MFFTNLVVYKFKQDAEFKSDDFNAALEQDAFRHCGQQELSTFGWAKAFGKYGESLAHFSDRRILVCAKREEKILPASVINEMVAEKVDQIELEENRLVRMKERNELKENVLHTLLPQAFTKSSMQYAFIDMDSGLLVVNSSSFNKAEELTALLRKSLGTLPIVPAFGQYDLDVFLTDWLTNFNTPQGFAIGSDAEMQEADDSGASVKLKGHELDGDEVKAHLELSGKRVTKLALNWSDRIKFNLQSDGAIKQVNYSDALKEENADIPKDDMPIKLDADFCLVACEIVQLVTELIDSGLDSSEQDDGNESLIAEHNAKYQDSNGNDAFYEEAKAFVQETESASVSRIQRKFRIGYNRAARLVEQLEANHIVTAPGHNGERTVIPF
ncbi:recombination associated protein RdgC [Pseudoalteromonas nigrifaciens]|uniref:Recombination-associated protein RdgC n=1 Tax=Pseudoalteromonas nigrifaciens TaxID=28109 RepID=A0AAC9UHJ6_9GAMM|nr:recombination associated protein RdgC [Pseudoalteromonas nigrifaciens]GEN40640.1 recombination-associated protein RdgC [Pseudoalteromonas nigrifaciens]SUC52510.1 Recombination-associated protein rdgC [Pseudoalteromonas nigrifaciens]